MELSPGRATPAEFQPVAYDYDVPLTEGVMVRKLVEHERMIGNQVAVVTVKPDDPEMDGYNFREDVEALLNESGASVLHMSERILSEDDVRAMYAPIFENRGEESEWITRFREDIIAYMTSGPIRSYLLAGYRAVDIADHIKGVVRARFIPPGQHKRVKNIIHTPDTQDVDKDMSILFEY